MKRNITETNAADYESPVFSELFLTAERGFAESGTGTASIYDWNEDESNDFNF